MVIKTNYSTTIRFAFILLFLVACTEIFFGQHVKVSGIANGRVNEMVRIIIFDDQFSRHENTLVTTTTDDRGNFELEFDVTQTTFAYLAVGLKRGEFYISPNSGYYFNILPDTSTQPGSIFDELPLRFTYTAEDGGLSDAVGSFNVQYNTFIYENANKIYRGRDRAFVKEFMHKIQGQFGSFDNEYLKNYIRYSFASLEWTSKMKDNDSIVSEYFIKEPILYNNIQYTEFFTDFFKTYFIVDKVFSYHELIDAINRDVGISGIKSLILRNESFKNDPQLTELITAMIVAKKYYNPDIKRNRILQLLKKIKDGSKYPENKKVAGNYIEKLQLLESGTPAPSFSLADVGSNRHNLSDYNGKFVLLSFIRSDCKICFEHLGLLDELEKQFHGKVQNITIVYGEDFKEVIQYAHNRELEWPFLKLDKNILLLEAYNIRVYPSYVIINPDGTIALATAPMPDENLDFFLNRQIKWFENKASGK